MSKRSRANVTVGNYSQLMLALQAAGGGFIGAAFQNRNVNAGIATVATLTAPTLGIFATSLLTSKASGLFFVMASGTATMGAVEAAGCTITLESNTPSTAATGITVTGGTIQAGTTTYLSSGTSPITLAAATGSLVGEQTQAAENGLNGLAASALVTPWSFAGIFGVNTASPVARVPVGNTIAFSIAGTVATTTLTISVFNFTVMEIPF